MELLVEGTTHMIIIGLIVTGLTSFAFIPLLVDLYGEQKRENYQKRMVPVGLGLGYVLVAAVAWLLHARFAQATDAQASFSLLYACTVVIFALIGMVDDHLGNRDQRGFSGH